MTNYVGVLDGGGKTWGVRIPDLPGCYGGGASAEAAIEDAASAAREWLAQQLSKGLAQPKARNLAAMIKASDIDASNQETAVIISVILDSGRTVRANLTFDAGLLEAIDNEATMLVYIGELGRYLMNQPPSLAAVEGDAWAAASLPTCSHQSLKRHSRRAVASSDGGQDSNTVCACAT